MALPLATLPSLPRLPFLREKIWCCRRGCGGHRSRAGESQARPAVQQGRAAAHSGTQNLVPPQPIPASSSLIQSGFSKAPAASVSACAPHLVQRVVGVLHAQPHQQRGQVGLEPAVHQPAALGCGAQGAGGGGPAGFRPYRSTGKGESRLAGEQAPVSQLWQGTRAPGQCLPDGRP